MHALEKNEKREFVPGKTANLEKDLFPAAMREFRKMEIASHRPARVKVDLIPPRLKTPFGRTVFRIQTNNRMRSSQRVARSREIRRSNPPLPAGLKVNLLPPRKKGAIAHLALRNWCEEQLLSAGRAIAGIFKPHAGPMPAPRPPAPDPPKPGEEIPDTSWIKEEKQA